MAVLFFDGYFATEGTEDHREKKRKEKKELKAKTKAKK
jgi:hypothetical protein